ncbi:uncharacterized protein LOC109854462 [Pseudomyrmex gracilis]|uniref:uncharacterized protein LOC109854462 n=1 Tax=Pseudomyrmex gracilis TaxID=219809 RepID=UPI00099584A2|nr:uncharacterized protein LOC109854462 [Pseudomyrmex gracilis]
MTGKFDERRKASRTRSCGLERPPTTLSTCHHYPPGCTVLECRLEANRPVARVVQVPADTAATARNSCLLARTRSSADRVSRKTSRSKARKDSSTADEYALLPTFHVLKSQDSKCSLAGKASVETVILDVTGDKQSDTPISKIIHCPSTRPVSEVCVTRDRADDQRRPASERTLRVKVARANPAKSDKASVCQRSARAVGRARLIPEEKVCGDTPPPQELLARCKNIPAYQFERYEARRSKRDGLQDEYVHPLLRSVLEKDESTTNVCIKIQQDTPC